MKIYTEKVVSEFIARVDGLEFSVKGRVTKSIDPETDHKFNWSISHYYCPSENAGPHYPSSSSVKTIGEAESLLLGYIRNFTCIRVVPNAFF